MKKQALILNKTHLYPFTAETRNTQKHNLQMIVAYTNNQRTMKMNEIFVVFIKKTLSESNAWNCYRKFSHIHLWSRYFVHRIVITATLSYSCAYIACNSCKSVEVVMLFCSYTHSSVVTLCAKRSFCDRFICATTNFCRLHSLHSNKSNWQWNRKLVKTVLSWALLLDIAKKHNYLIWNRAFKHC